MATSIDFFPDGNLYLTARAQPVSGNPVRLEFVDDSARHVADFTIFTRSAPLAVRLEHAINVAMRAPNEAVTRDAIEELIGENTPTLHAEFNRVSIERDQLYWHVQDLIGLVQLVRNTLPPGQQDDINKNFRLANAAAYLTQIAPPISGEPASAIAQSVAPGVAEVFE